MQAAPSPLFPGLTPPPAPPPRRTTLGPPPPVVTPPAAAAAGAGAAPPQSLTLQEMIRQEADKAGVPWQLAFAVADQESSFRVGVVNPQAVAGGQHAVGTFQLLPETAKTFGVDQNDPYENIVGGVKYLRQLLDRYQGDPKKTLEAYGGVVKDTTYVPAVLAKMQKYATPAAPPAAPGFWGTLADSLDPHERMGRQNIAGGIGSMVGGLAGGFLGGLGGGAAGTVVEPGGGTAAGLTAGAIWGRRAGSAVGAAIGGGLEQAAIEETPIGGLISKLPYGTQDEPTPPPDPNSTYASRVGGAALNQGATDVAGQALMLPLRIAGKRIVQSRIGQSAATALESARATAAEAFKNTQIVLGQQLRAASRAARETAADLSARIAERMDQLRVDELTNTIRPARAAKLATVDAGKAEAARIAAEHDALIEQARQHAAEKVTGATTAREAALAGERAAHEATVAASAPSAAGAGRAVADVFEDAAQVPRRTLGAAVDEAAASGPFKDISELKAEADRLNKEEVLPRIFPNQQAASVIDTILNESKVVSFQRLHELKKQLQEALRGVYDKASRTQMQGATLKLTKMIREMLTGHAPYDAATKAYEDVIPRYTTQLAKTIRRAARGSPEEIAQMINIEKPTQAGFLTKLMTESASEGGDAAGGRRALENVQDFWFHKNIFEGPLEGLGERLAKLKRRPDFVRAFLGDARMKGIITRAEEFAASYPELVAQHDAAVAAAKATGQAGIDAATAAKDQALQEAGATSMQQIRKAQAAIEAAIDKANAKKATARAAGRAEKKASKATQDDLVEAARKAKETAPRDELKAAADALETLRNSTIGGKLRDPAQVAADVIGAMRPTSVFSGLSMMRTFFGASDADIARYVVYGSKPVKALTKAMVTSTFARTAPAIASQVAVKPWTGSEGERRARQVTAPGPPPRR